MSETIRKAISIAGGAPALAALISEQMGMKKPLTAMAVRQWMSRGVPAEYCIPIERALDCKVFRHELRPDLYPPEEYEFLSIVGPEGDLDGCSLLKPPPDRNRENHTCIKIQ